MGCELGGWIPSHSWSTANGGAAAWFQWRTCIYFKFWNDRMESVSKTPVGWVANYDRRQTKNLKKFPFHDSSLVTDFIEGFILATMIMKNFVLIKLRLVWAIRPIWWMGWYDPIVGVWPDLTQFLGKPRADPSGTLFCAYTDDCINLISKSLTSYKEWKYQNDVARIHVEGLIGWIKFFQYSFVSALPVW